MPHPAFTDTVTRVRTTRDDWGETSSDVDIEISSRIVTTSKVLVANDGRTLQMSYRVLLPADADVLISDQLKVGDETYTIHRLETTPLVGGYNVIMVAMI